MGTYLTFIPFVNRQDLLLRALASIKEMWPRTLVIDNSETRELSSANLPVRVFTPPVPLDFAQSQNLMQLLTFEGNCDFYFFMHADAEAQSQTAQKLLELIAGLPADWGLVLTNGDAFCAFNVSAVKTVGKWDWRGLNWYFSDKDYYRRIKLAGFKTIESGLAVNHTPSQTRAADGEIEMVVNAQLTAANTYYIFKWGGPPGKEIFLSPFNREAA